MTDHGWVTVLGTVPSKANDYKIAKFGNFTKLVKDKAVTDYEDVFAWQCSYYRGMSIEGLFEYHCKVFYNSIRPDLDNSLKVQLDCLQKVGAIKNDNKCIKIVAEKYVDKNNPRLEFKIVEL